MSESQEQDGVVRLDLNRADLSIGRVLDQLFMAACATREASLPTTTKGSS
jgi:hypothetical protein